MQIRSGFIDPAGDAQRVFRAMQSALAEPGLPQKLECRLDVPPRLPRSIAALALTLADHETVLWLDGPLASCAEVRDYLLFHTEAAITEDPGAATFALAASTGHLPAITTFSQGTDENPELATTLFLSVEEVTTSGGWMLSGPGIPGQRRLAVAGLDDAFWSQLREQRAQFPLGVDVFLATASSVVGLPRSLRISEA